MKALIWRETRGYIRSRIFTFSVIITLLGLIALIGGPKDGFLFNYLHNNLPDYIIINVVLFLVWYLLQDKQTGEIQWLLMLPVKKIQIYISKYIAGLGLSVCFGIVLSIVVAVIYNGFLKSFLILFNTTVGYTVAYIMGILIWILFSDFEIETFQKR